MIPGRRTLDTTEPILRIPLCCLAPTKATLIEDNCKLLENSSTGSLPLPGLSSCSPQGEYEAEVTWSYHTCHTTHTFS